MVCIVADNGYGMSQVVVVDSQPTEITSANIFYIAVGCACAMIAVIVIVVTA